MPLPAPSVDNETRGVILMDMKALPLIVALGLLFSTCDSGGASSPGDIPASMDAINADNMPTQDAVPSDDGGVAPIPGSPTTENLLGGAELVILAHEDLLNALDPLVLWKNQRGLPTLLVPLEEALLAGTGPDQPARIRSWIRHMRDTAGTRYVLLAGDTNLLPVRQVTQEMYNEAEDFHILGDLATDLYYGDLDGDWDGDGDGILAELEDGLDLLPDVAVGRLPARSPSETSRWVEKVLAYERDPATNYQHKALLMGEWAGDVGGFSLCSTAALDGVIVPLLPEHVEVTKLFDPECPMSAGALPASPAAQIAQMNAGQGWILNFGHGWLETLSSLDLDDMDALTSGDQPSIYLTTECNSCEFDYPTLPHVACEEYVLAKGGGVAYIGNTEFGVGAPWLMSWYRDFVVRMYELPGAALGDLMMETTRTFADPAEAQKPLSDLRWTYLALILMGDPSLLVFTDRPGTLNPVIKILHKTAEETALSVQTNASDGFCVEGATVALYAPGVFLNAGVTSTDCLQMFHWKGTGPSMPYTVTVTAPNYVPYIETIQ